MEFIPVCCPVPHANEAITAPHLCDVEAGVAVTIRLKCKHKHIPAGNQWVTVTVDAFGNSLVFLVENVIVNNVAVCHKEVKIPEDVFMKVGEHG